MKCVYTASGCAASMRASYSPATGSQPRRWKNTCCRISPSQKIGIDTLSIVSRRIPPSSVRPRLRAAAMPSGSPTTAAIRSAASTSSSDAGTAVARSSSTGRWVCSAVPQSPVATPLM